MTAELHLAVCRRFSDAVAAADGLWDRPSPCDGWDARSVLEHVIGFHDVLLLRPSGLKPDRPADDARRRWELTVLSLGATLSPDPLSKSVIDVPAVGNDPEGRTDITELLPRLTRDVLVHTWDLARAVGADDRLDPGLCRAFLDELPIEANVLSDSGMFAPPVTVGDHADVQSVFLACLGRDPSWTPKQR